jgi:hypothetical protein
MILIPEIRITVSKTADGKGDYVQVMSSDQFNVNLVVIAGKVTIADTREPDDAENG